VSSFESLYFKRGAIRQLGLLLSVLLLNTVLYDIAASKETTADSTPHSKQIQSNHRSPNNPSIILTATEKEWLAENPEIPYTGAPNWLPYEAFKPDGTNIGIVADHLKLMEERTGIRFKPISPSSWTESLRMATEGKVSAISGDAADQILNQHFKSTDTYSRSPVVVVMNSREDYVEELEEIKGSKIVIIKDYGYTSEILKTYPDINFIEVNNIQEGLEGVSQGRYDAMLATMALASYTMAEMGIHNVKIVGKTPITMELTLFVSKEQPYLHAILNKALKSISIAESQHILQRWNRNKYVENTDYNAVWRVGFILLLILLVTLTWNRWLQREIIRRKAAEEALKESQALLEEAQKMARVGNWTLNPETMKGTWSKEVYRILGIDAEMDAGTEYLATALHPDDRESVLRSLQRATKEPYQHNMEYRILRPNGEIRWINCLAEQIFDDQGKVIKLRGVAQDITQRKIGALSLQKSEAHFKALSEAGFEAIFISENGYCISQNLAAEKMFGYTLDEAVGRLGANWFAEESRALVKRNMLSGFEEAYEAIAQHKNGLKFPVAIRGKMMRYQDRSVRMTAILDMTEQKQTEKAIRESEARFRQLFENTDAIAVQGYDKNRTIFYWNSASEKLYGYKAEEAIGQQLEDLIIPASIQDRAIAEISAWVDTEADMPSSELELCKADGSLVKVFSNHVMLRGRHNEPEMYCVDIDLTQLKIAEDTLRASEAYLRSLSEAMPDLILVIDASGFITKTNRVQSDNPALDMIGKSITQYIPEESKQAFSEAFQSAFEKKQLQTLELKIILPEGQSDFLSRLNPIHLPDRGGSLVLIATDITERKQAERRLRRTQKMDALGQLTGGIAHDFNNILGIILGNLNLLESQTKTDKVAHKRVSAIKKSAERAAKLTKQMLGFSRQQSAEVAISDVNLMIREMKNLIVKSVTPKIEVSMHLAKHLWLTEVDPGDFQDGLLNLIFNARDAMPSGGQLTISTCNCTLDEDYCAKSQGIKPGEYIQIAINDNGHGIPTDQQEHIFEPFYTTKAHGKGTGLGLAMVFGFVNRSGGYIEVDSSPTSGTTFRLYLPHAKGNLLPKTKHDTSSEKSPRGNEKILAVDDEEGLLELAQDTLQMLGYQVITAKNGAQALSLLEQNTDIDLLFSDIVMPGGIDGYELAKKALEKYPDLKILLTSGYTGKVIGGGPSSLKSNILSKPYNHYQLAHRIRALLGTQPKIANDTAPSPPTIKWHSQYSIGIEKIDSDHKKVLDLLDRSRNAIFYNNRHEAQAFLKEFITLCQYHFRREEEIMTVCGYQGRTNHKQVHQLLLKKAEKLSRASINDEANLDKLATSLTDGWIDHIQTMDRAYVKNCLDKESLIEEALRKLTVEDKKEQTERDRL